MDGARRPRDRVDLLLALVPALIGGGVAAAVALSWDGCRCELPVSMAFALPFVVLTVLPVLWARSAPLGSSIALGLATGLGYVVSELLRVAGAQAPYAVGMVHAAIAATALAAAFPASYLAAHRRGGPVLAAVLAVLVTPTMSLTVFMAWGIPAFDMIAGEGVLLLSYVGLLAPAWSAGLVRGRRARWAAERARRATERAEHAIRAERARVLRELQALVLADLASIGQQAERADRDLGAAPLDPTALADTRTALLTITAAGRDSLTAMRRLLGMLRTTEPDAARDPQPTLDRLDELVDTHRRAGLDVRLTVTGERRTLPDDVDLAAYRLLQHLLAGCDRTAAVQLQVDYTDHALRLVARGDVGDGCGVTVREWAHMVDGDVTADTDASTVEVVLPTRPGRAA